MLPPTGFSVRGFEALFPCAGTLGCTVCLAPQLFLPAYSHTNVGPPGPPATTLPQVLSAWLPISAPPTGLDECFFFNSLVVELPYSLIFCQFWLFLFLNLLSFFWLYEEAQCVYLCLHLGWKSRRKDMKPSFLIHTAVLITLSHSYRGSPLGKHLEKR